MKKRPDKTKKAQHEPTNWDLFECLLGLSERIFTLEKIVKNLMFMILTINLITMILVLSK